MVSELYLWEVKFSYKVISWCEAEIKVVTKERSFAEAEEVSLEAIEKWKDENLSKEYHYTVELESIKPKGTVFVGDILK